ncbi:hypothetical protein SAY86_018887 [Trapa natans]|uniref:F-box domain-containing protein n=1 Tax=Trapa natans TaxID=22666 RepID=A0AAN7QYG7_TRANT|nr:hypothetical protein SAY86_018887 [Trapa natans]
MKLRLRSLQTRETLKLDVPDNCTLHHLKHVLASRSSPAPSVSSVRVSLNRKDELGSSSPDEGGSLRVLGVTSGDLVYYSLDPNAFGPPLQQVIAALAPNSSIPQPPNSVESEQANAPSGDLGVMEVDSSAKGEGLGGQSMDLDMNDGGGKGEENFQDGIPGADFNSVDAELDVYKYSVPYFLRRILREELGNDEVELRLVVIAVHAVMLESGFVGFNSVTGARVDGFHLPDRWPSASFTVSLCYTLPELLADGSNEVERVVLKFQNIGHYLTVYGSLARGKSGLHRICLDEYRFVPTIDMMWANCDKKDGASHGEGNTSSYPDSEVFEFWKIVKDGLALPLLIDISERANLPLPSCFMCLPAELKLQILELLDAGDLLRVALVCSELRYLSSHNDLWKQKFLGEFGSVKEIQGAPNWKLLYMTYMKRRRDKDTLLRMSLQVERPIRAIRPYLLRGMWGDRAPLRMPGIIGDHDWLLTLGPSFAMQQGPFPRIQNRTTFGPNCNLGGLNH